MISKPLFKQSWKANGVMWAIITFAVCFMLATVMLIAGNGDIVKTKIAVENAMIQGELDASIENRAINYYEVSNSALTYFNGKLTEHSTSADEGERQNAYALALGDLDGYAAAVATAQGFTPESTEGQEIKGIIFYTLNPQTAPNTYKFDEFYESFGETPARYDVSKIGDENYVSEYALMNSSVFLSGQMVNPQNIEAVVAMLKDYGMTKEKYSRFGYTDYEKVKSIARSSLLNYTANLEYRLKEEAESLSQMSAEAKAERIQAIKQELSEKFSSSFLTTLPKDVSDAIEDIGSMDLYGILVGSIFFKIAGLLLPIIYIIMASNNLIAGQVDSGSMAYVLSTPTKRKTVIATQALFLVLSVFLMFVCTTITSIVCFSFIEVDSMLTIGKLLLINLGAFTVMFAMSGISFLTSSVFNRSKHAMALGGGINIFFLVATILGLFGSSVIPSVIRMEALNFFNCVSIISLFDVISILDGTLAFLWKFAILAVVGIVCYLVSFKRFKEKDLPL